MILSHIIIWGVETTEQHTVDIADDRKSIPGPKLECITSAYRERETRLFICLRTSSKTAKLTAPCGMDKMSCAPAPRVKCLACFHCVNDLTVNGVWPGMDLDDCSIVFIVFAGCIIVCAALRLMAPHTMASQKCKRRPSADIAAAAAPPLLTLSAMHSSSSSSLGCCKSSEFLIPGTTSLPILFKDVRRC